jgi:hypothetical protein
MRVASVVVLVVVVDELDALDGRVVLVLVAAGLELVGLAVPVELVVVLELLEPPHPARVRTMARATAPNGVRLIAAGG